MGVASRRIDVCNFIGRARPAKPALLEALVVDDEAAAVPEEDLHAIVRAAEEDEEVTGERVLLPLLAHDGEQAVVAHPHVDRRGGHVDPNAARKAQHRAASAAASSAT
jgi:hypothetical protein